MNKNEDLYCRLCAETKPSNKLLDLQRDNAKKGEIMEKLTRLNASFLDLTISDNLPKTICFDCSDTLDKALNFLLQIQNAQNILKDIFIDKIIKKEDLPEEQLTEQQKFNLSTLESIKTEEKPLVEIKIENNYDTDQYFEDIVHRRQKVRKKKKQNNMHILQDVLDALDEADVPLSKIKCMTWKDYPWLCWYCNTQFFTVDELKIHSMQNHNSCMPFKCIDCVHNTKKSFRQFLAHVSKHKKHLKLCCYLCNEEFLSKHELNLHKQDHFSDSNLQCPGCSTCFDTFQDLNEHMEIYIKKHKNKTLTLSCEVCNKTFANNGNLNKHKQIHTNRQRDHTCEKCGKQFYDKGTLTSHMMLHENLRKHKCQICPAAFRTASRLRTHVGIHGGLKPYTCDQCGQKFRLNTQLKSHLIIHTDNLPYICEYCSKAFRFKTILKQHLRLHTGVKPYSCEVCLREFTNWPNYNKHMKRRHNMDMSKKKRTPEGVFPVNPATGEIHTLPITSKTEEWRKKVLVPQRRGRPKLNPPSHEINTDTNVETLERSNEEIK